jgi:hypothetical protein
MNKKIIITILSFAAGIGLVYFGLKLFISPEETEVISSKPFSFHFYSFLFILPIYMFNGIQTFILLNMMYRKSISVYDTFTLPFAVSLWGFLMPFQGSYIYNSIYFKSKYKITIANTTSISIMALSISLLMAGALGVIYCFVSYSNVYFLLLSAALLIHPAFIFIFLKLSGRIGFKNFKFFTSILETARTIFSDYLNAFNVKSVFILLVLNAIDSLLASLWCFWVSVNFGLGLTFFQILILQFFLKAAVLFKFTPGNLGVTQFASSGIILLAGGIASEGFTLSLYQSAISIFVSFILGSVFSLVNFRYFFNTSDK